MKQLQDVERLIQEGDLLGIHQLIDEFFQSQDFDQMYDAAGLLAEFGYLAEADRLYSELLQHFPDEAQLKIDRAITLIELGDEDEVLLLLTDVKPTDEEYVQSLLVLADYYQMIGLIETALDKMKEAYDLEPNEPVLQFAYAELLLVVGRYEQASRMYEALGQVVSEIGGVEIISRLAEVYSASGSYEKAIPYYEQLIMGNPSPDQLFGAAFAFYQTQQPTKALPLLQQLIETDPDYYSAYMLGGQSFITNNEDQKAYDMFLEGLRRDEFDKELLLSAGKIALKLGLVEKAEAHLKEALVLDPEYIEAIVALASFYNMQERYEDLLELLMYAKEYTEEIPLLTAFMAYANDHLEHYADAYVSYSKAYVEMKSDYEFLTKYASFLIEEGKRDEAVAVVRELIKNFPEDQNWRAFLESQIDEEV